MDDPRRIQELAALLGEAVVPTEGALSEDDTGLKPCAATELSEDRWRLLSAATEVSEDRRRLLTGFLFSLWGTENLPRGVFELLDQISRHEPIREELVQVLGLLEERAAHLSFPIAQELAWTHPVPLSVHSRYALDEVVAAFGRSTVERPYRLREGVMFDAATQSDVFFVTLEKSEARYSPTTMYKDYAISPVLFHQGRSRER